jgi:hypothetical protein
MLPTGASLSRSCGGSGFAVTEPTREMVARYDVGMTVVTGHEDR